MKITPAEATGCPAPQFIIYPESEEDRIILKMFLEFPRASKDEWVLVANGPVWTSGKITSFNFGWNKKS